MKKDSILSISLLAVLALSLGCGSSVDLKKRKPGEFPTKEDLASLIASRGESNLFETNQIDVDTWELVGPLPDTIGVEAISSPLNQWERLLTKATSDPNGDAVASVGMRCVAREMGNFYVSNSAWPSESLKRFIRARCGCASQQLQITHTTGKVPRNVSVNKIFESWKSPLEDTLSKIAQAKNTTVGIWFGRNDNEAVAIVASTQNLLDLEPMANTPAEDGTISFSGKTLNPIGVMFPRINKGKTGVEPCVLDNSAILPDVKITCSPEPSDEYTWITLGATPPGRVLGSALVELLVWPGGSPKNVYHKPNAALDTTFQPTSDTHRDLVNVINQVRDQVGMQKLVLEDAASNTATELVPYFYGSTMGVMNPLVGDTVALGMMAGWEVKGLVKSGLMTSLISPNVINPSRYIADLLDNPSGRTVLLDPTASSIAIGAVQGSKEEGIAGIFTTYVLISPEDEKESLTKVRTLYNAAREEKGLQELQSIQGLSEALNKAVANVKSGAFSENEAMSTLLADTTKRTGKSAKGWVVTTSDPQNIELPPDLINTPSGGYAITLGSYRPQNHPWGRYVVFFVVTTE